MHCTSCGTKLRASDAFCPSCGEETKVAPPRVPTETAVQAGISRRTQAANFLAQRARVIVTIGVVAAIVAAVVFVGDEEQTVPEDHTSTGYKLVRNLKGAGDIDSFKSIEPEDGWEVEYSLNDGDGHIRFRGSEMESEVRSYEDGLSAAIKVEAKDLGFTGE